MDLILWRHAEAEDGVNDLLRPLTAKGHQQAERMSEWLKLRLPSKPLVIASQAKRSQQTASYLDSEFKIDASINPNAHYAAILSASQWPHARECVVLVGHQPTLGETASMLLSGHAEITLSIKKGAIWWFCNRTRQDETQTILKVMMTPDMLRA